MLYGGVMPLFLFCNNTEIKNHVPYAIILMEEIHICPGGEKNDQ